MSEQVVRANRKGSIGKLVLYASIGLAIACLLSLGTWQVKRLAWKEALIARIDARIHGAPRTIASDQDWQALIASGDFDYIPVTVTGRLDHRREVLVYTVSEFGPGYWVMTPLETDFGSALIVNRGFVSKAFRDRATRADNLPRGPVTVTGLMRSSQVGGLLFRPNVPQDNRWFSRDVALMAGSMQLDDFAPFFLDVAKEEGGQPGAVQRVPDYPIPGLTRISFPNNHLSYAITWYGLAVMLVALLIFARRAEPD